jgi:hypothetical protein
MNLFEDLYGRRRKTLVSWDNPMIKNVVGLEMFNEMEQEIVRIKHNLKVAQYR